MWDSIRLTMVNKESQCTCSSPHWPWHLRLTGKEWCFKGHIRIRKKWIKPKVTRTHRQNHTISNKVDLNRHRRNKNKSCAKISKWVNRQPSSDSGQREDPVATTSDDSVLCNDFQYESVSSDWRKIVSFVCRHTIRYIGEVEFRW